MDNGECTVLYRFLTAGDNVTVIIQTCYVRVALATLNIIIIIITTATDDDDSLSSIPVLVLFWYAMDVIKIIFLVECKTVQWTCEILYFAVIFEELGAQNCVWS